MSKAQRSKKEDKAKTSLLNIPKLPKDSKGENEEFLHATTPETIAPAAQIVFAETARFQRRDALIDWLPVKGQLEDIENIEKSIEKLSSYIPFLYSYRSISKAINNNEIPNDQKIISTTLKSEGVRFDKKSAITAFNSIFINTLLQLLEMHECLTQTISMVNKIVETLKYDPTDVFFQSFTELLVLLFNIEDLKMVKSGFVNDLSFFRRFVSEPHKLVNLSDDIFARFQVFQLWLPARNTHFSKLQDAKSFYSKYLEYCCNTYDTPFLLPKQRHAIVIGIVTALKVTNGKIDTSLAQKCLSVIEKNNIVPLYAENNFAPGYIIAEMNDFPAKTSNLALNQDQLKSHENEFLLKNKMDKYREMYRQSYELLSSIKNNESYTEKDLLTLLSNASELANAIRLQFAFKMIVRKKMDDKSNSITNYDKGVKYNHSPEDLNALVELIGYVKTLSSSATLLEDKIASRVSDDLHYKIQDFVQNDLEKLLIQAHDEPISAGVLNHIRNTFGFWEPGVNPANVGKKATQHKIKHASIMYSDHYLKVLSVQINSLIKSPSSFIDKSKKGGKIIQSKNYGQYQEFSRDMQNYSLLVNYSHVLRDATNLGSLWFREVFLDIDQIVQFPVRSSLPFILAEHLLKNINRPALHDSITFPFEIYNDAASMALNTFKSQYLYREIEAEMSLCVEMITFTFSEAFYKTARQQAAALELPLEYAGKISPKPMRYQLLVQQNKLILLGSQIDFNRVATSKLNMKLLKILQAYIEMLSDIRLAPYVAHLIRVAKTTHTILVENHLRLEPFDELWQRAKGFTQPLSLESDLVSQVIRALEFSRYRFNCITRRFIANKLIQIPALTNEEWASIYKIMHTVDASYIGEPHYKAIYELLSPGELSCLIQKCTLLLEEEMSKFIDLFSKVSPSIKMLHPLNKDELSSFYSFNSDAYQGFIHPNLGTLLNSMRTIGNIISFIWCIENETGWQNKNSLLSPVFNLIKALLLNNSALFIQPSEIDLETNTTHRTFPCLWTILEFMICSPKSIKMNENSDPFQPLETFGDGPIIAAHIFIQLCNQEPYSQLDSLNRRSLELANVERSTVPNPELDQYILYAKYAQQASLFASLLAGPYVVNDIPEQ